MTPPPRKFETTQDKKYNEVSSSWGGATDRGDLYLILNFSTRTFSGFQFIRGN